MEDELKAILDSGNIPPNMSISYNDVHGLWGGTMIAVLGGGRWERHERLRGDAEPEVFEGKVDRGQLLELVRLLFELRAWEQRTPERLPVPDESRATFKITTGGQTSFIWEWFNEMQKNGHLALIKAKMSKIAAAK